MGTLVMVFAVTFNTMHVETAGAPAHLTQVHATAQVRCEAEHPAGQAKPLDDGRIVLDNGLGLEAALFGCYVPTEGVNEGGT